MKTNNNERMEQVLRNAFQPTQTQPRSTLRRDLWPTMRQRLQDSSVAVAWFDWALIAAVIAGFALFPLAIPVLLFHL